MTARALQDAAGLAKRGALTRSPLAVIIKGNPTKGPPTPGRLYPELQGLLEDMGYAVEMDEGLPHTTPRRDAAVWVGHSRGASRLQWAPSTVTTVAVGDVAAPGAQLRVVHP